MKLPRREFITSTGGAFMAYGFRFLPDGETPSQQPRFARFDNADEVCRYVKQNFDYHDWLLIGSNGTVTALTGRTEIGQGLETVIVALVSQALEIPPKAVDVVMGDTQLCPDDGATQGSSATRQVGWGFWQTALAASTSLRQAGAEVLGLVPEQVEVRQGRVESALEPSMMVGLSQLVVSSVVLVDLEPSASQELPGSYTDRELDDVRARDIVTGAQQYVGDLGPGGLLYGAYLRSPYHEHLSPLISADLDRARTVPGVAKVGIVRGRPAVVGDSYHAVELGLKAITARWRKPPGRAKLNLERDIRRGAQLVTEIENIGNVDAPGPGGGVRLDETYITHFTTQAPLETDSAVADVRAHGTTVWVASQGPHLQRALIARRLGLNAGKVRVSGMPVGGGYGGKISNTVGGEAAELSRFARAPVKYLYSRADQFVGRARAKEPCVIDISSTLNADGTIHTRHIDIINDTGHGTLDTYKVPNSRTRLYKTQLPLRHAVVRGTSFMQVNFAVESHMSHLAELAGIDRVEFRRRNVQLEAFNELLAAGADLIRYSTYRRQPDHGLGVSVINHGARELGVFFVEVKVNRKTGVVRVKRVCCALDIGTVINRRNCTVNVRGAIMWGIGYCLVENLVADRHRVHARVFGDYEVPSFRHTPEIDIAWLQAYPDNGPRGVGEMPCPAIAPAVADAIHDAVGIRLYQTPFTPQRVLAALRQTSEGGVN